MIKHLVLYIIVSAALMHFADFSFFQVLVICLLFGIYNMVYFLVTEVEWEEL